MHRRFALGFEAPDPERDGTHAITALVEGGPAAGAGLREGDIIRELRYVPGDPNTGVDVSVERDGSVRAIRFMPTDRSTPGRGWRRNPAVPDEECTF
jgi:C-terminal processing protease CtpA/Prc